MSKFKLKMQQFGYKMQGFMAGRYGIDKLFQILLISYFIIAILANVFYRASKITSTALYVMASALLIYAIFRIFSKNIQARQAENAKWLCFENKIKKNFEFEKTKWQQRKTHKFVKCKNCKKVLRLPKHRGKLSVTCPHCQNQFTVNTGKKVK